MIFDAQFMIMEDYLMIIDDRSWWLISPTPNPYYFSSAVLLSWSIFGKGYIFVIGFSGIGRF